MCGLIYPFIVAPVFDKIGARFYCLARWNEAVAPLNMRSLEGQTEPLETVRQIEKNDPDQLSGICSPPKFRQKVRAMAQRGGLGGSVSVDLAAYDYLLDLTKPGFAWEFARRSLTLQRAALHCRPGRPRRLRIGKNARLYRLRRRYSAAERFGLHHIPDPHLTASEVVPFWLPDMLTSSIHLHIARRLLPRAQRFDLCRLPGFKHVLIPVTGAPELVLQGDHYAGYFALDGRWRLLPRRFYLKVGLSAFDKFPAQIDAATRLFRACSGDGLAPWRERAFGPKRLQRAVLAYDIRTKYGGSHWDAARIIYGYRKVEQARKRGDSSLRERARRSFKMAHMLVHGGHRRLLR